MCFEVGGRGGWAGAYTIQDRTLLTLPHVRGSIPRGNRLSWLHTEASPLAMMRGSDMIVDISQSFIAPHTPCPATIDKSAPRFCQLGAVNADTGSLPFGSAGHTSIAQHPSTRGVESEACIFSQRIQH